ncbi:hypothetical protein [Erwinia sp.]|uniref:hypothetical protein n=1 Tax=Erwinia citreus TaxID=558 RepID=UPI0028A2155D|nr:hypothetical protein [Erwinia sp.]
MRIANLRHGYQCVSVTARAQGFSSKLYFGFRKFSGHARIQRLNKKVRERTFVVTGLTRMENCPLRFREAFGKTDKN